MKKALTVLCAVTFSLAALSGCCSAPKKSASPMGTEKEVNTSCCSVKTN